MASASLAKHNLCTEERKASLACITANYEDRGKCEDTFDAYKECKKLMTLERRKPNKTLDQL